jgi:hypothetical protein
MATVNIYQDSEQIDFILIRNQFYIIERPNGELYWYEHSRDAPYKTGVYKIWLQSVKYRPKIHLVLPDWQVIVDNVWFEKKAYDGLENLQGKKVELRYRNYAFVFDID